MKKLTTISESRILTLAINDLSEMLTYEFSRREENPNNEITNFRIKLYKDQLNEMSTELKRLEGKEAIAE